MTEYILCITIVLTMLVLYMVYKKGILTLFDKLCSMYLLYVFIHAVYSFVTLKFFLLSEIEIIGSPFVFGYGPFFITGLKILSKRIVSKKQIYINCIPIVVFGLAYIILLAGDVEWKEYYFRSFFILECSFAVISVFIYSFLTMLIAYPVQDKIEANSLRGQLIRIGGFSLIFMGILFAVAAISGMMLGKDVGIGVAGFVMFSGILTSIVLAFIFEVNNITQIHNTAPEVINELSEGSNNSFIDDKRLRISVGREMKENKVGKMEEVTQPTQKYNKSALSPIVLSDYKEKLHRLIDKERVYLDNELTLEALAKQIKMPMHHLTQLFNVHLGENFNQYINRYRIDHAKTLLENNDGLLSIEQIAFSSGFNSKVSFNRHFKSLTGYTPKEYSYINKPSKE